MNLPLPDSDIGTHINLDKVLSGCSMPKQQVQLHVYMVQGTIKSDIFWSQFFIDNSFMAFSFTYYSHLTFRSSLIVTEQPKS